MNKKLNSLALAITLALSANAQVQAAPVPVISLEAIGTHTTGIFDEGAAEIVAHDARNQRIFKINANVAAVEVLDINDPENPSLMGTIDASKLGGGANSVAVYKDLVAVAVEAEVAQDPGLVAFYDSTDLSLIGTVGVGALPDMVTFTPNGQYALVANEGEPNDDYTVDPEGSISVIDLRHGVASATVKTANFNAWDGKEDELRAAGVRVGGRQQHGVQEEDGTSGHCADGGAEEGDGPRGHDAAGGVGVGYSCRLYTSRTGFSGR